MKAMSACNSEIRDFTTLSFNCSIVAALNIQSVAPIVPASRRSYEFTIAVFRERSGHSDAPTPRSDADIPIGWNNV
jgi:hypothetical protein